MKPSGEISVFHQCYSCDAVPPFRFIYRAKPAAVKAKPRHEDATKDEDDTSKGAVGELVESSVPGVKDGGVVSVEDAGVSVPTGGTRGDPSIVGGMVAEPSVGTPEVISLGMSLGGSEIEPISYNQQFREDKNGKMT